MPDPGYMYSRPPRRNGIYDICCATCHRSAIFTVTDEERENGRPATIVITKAKAAGWRKFQPRFSSSGRVWRCPKCIAKAKRFEKSQGGEKAKPPGKTLPSTLDAIKKRKR